MLRKDFFRKQQQFNLLRTIMSTAEMIKHYVLLHKVVRIRVSVEERLDYYKSVLSYIGY